MRIISAVTIFILLSLHSNAQLIKYKIKGKISGDTDKKYAYLTTLSQQRTISNDKIFEKAPIIDGKFQFEGLYELDGELYQKVCLFIDQSGEITKEEVASKFYNLIWVVGRDSHLKDLILENMSLEFKGRNLSIVDGGIYSRQYFDLISMMKDKSKIYERFIKKYPDSPISLYSLAQAYPGFTRLNYDRSKALWGDPYVMYNLLSDRLKNSEKGIKLKKDMDAFFND